MPQNPAISVFLSDFISADIAPQNKRSLMFHHKWIARSILIAGLVIGYAQQSSAETFTGAALMEWPESSRNYYLQTSVTMAGAIVAQKDAEAARCIDDWHVRQRGSDYAEVLSVMADYPQYHPQGILIAVLRNKCRAF